MKECRIVSSAAAFVRKNPNINIVRDDTFRTTIP